MALSQWAWGWALYSGRILLYNLSCYPSLSDLLSSIGESDAKAELKKEREERESFEDEATMKIKKLEHDNENLEAENDAVKAEERDIWDEKY